MSGTAAYKNFRQKQQKQTVRSRPTVSLHRPVARRERIAGFTILNWPSERPARAICTGCVAYSVRCAVKAPKQSATRDANQLSSAVPMSASAIPSILARQASLSSQGLGMPDAPYSARASCPVTAFVIECVGWRRMQFAALAHLKWHQSPAAVLETFFDPNDFGDFQRQIRLSSALMR